MDDPYDGLSAACHWDDHDWCGWAYCACDCHADVDGYGWSEWL